MKHTRQVHMQALVIAMAVIWAVAVSAQPPGHAQHRFLRQHPTSAGEAPAFELMDTFGDSVSLNALTEQGPFIMVFGSISCPVWRAIVPMLKRCAERTGDRARCVMVYTIEAHPRGSKSPYADGVWVHETNVREGVLINQPTTYEQRLQLARDAAKRLGDAWTVLVDDMQNSVWKAYGSKPNSAYVINAEGIVEGKQLWADPGRLVQDVGAARPQQARLQMPEGVTAECDITYAEPDGIAQKLDAYWHPEGDPHPAVVLIHGGGWRGGDNAGYGPMAVNFCKRGVAAFSLNYRLSNVATYPAAVDDCLAAIRFIRANADRFNIDPDNLALQGGSAGGHLVLMMSFVEPAETDTDSEGNRLENFAVCCMAQNPPTDLKAMRDTNREPHLIAFLGGDYPDMPERYAEASPVTHLSPDDPPVLILHGTADRTVPYSQAILLKDAMDRAGVPCELMTFEGAGHGLKGIQPEERRRASEYAFEWILEHLGMSTGTGTDAP